MEKVLDELATGSPASRLRHVDESKDRSAPVIETGTHVHQSPQPKLLQEIQTGAPLRHVNELDMHDASSPKVEDVVLHPHHRDELLQEVRSVGGHHAVMAELKQSVLEEWHEGGPPLRHVTDKHDASAPAIPADAHVKQWDKARFLGEIREPHFLNTVDPGHIHDCSAPRVAAGAAAAPGEPNQATAGASSGGPSGQATRAYQQQRSLHSHPLPPHPFAEGVTRAEVAKEASSPLAKQALRHVVPSQVHDASSPVFGKTEAMRVTAHQHEQQH